MRKATLKGLLAHKLRLALTALSVVLGVAFVSGTFVLTDTINHTFDNLFQEVTQGTDVTVRARSGFGEGGGVDVSRDTVPESLLGTVRAVPGVRVAEGTVGGLAQLVDPKGKAITTTGAPTLGFNWTTEPSLSPLRLREGSPPQRDGEVVVDVRTAKDHKLRVGDHVRVVFRTGTAPFTIVGLTGFGEADNLAGATISAFELRAAQSHFGKEGVYDTVDAAKAGGITALELRSRIQRALPEDVEAVTGDQVAKESADSIKQFTGIFSTALLAFAGISLFVGAFIIFNTFSILVAQRTRELGLLRALGASRGQVMGSVLAEALVMGVVSSAIGLGLGVLFAIGLQALLEAFGLDLPTSTTQFLPRTVIASVIVGVGVTFVAAIAPGRRAGRVSPMAALRAEGADTGGSLRTRSMVGSACAAAGLAALFIGLFGNMDNGLPLVGLGAALTFLGVAVVSPLVARPLAAFIGAPLARLGLASKLGRQNAMRNPRRTAATAAALMIGLGLVGAVSVLGSSIKKSSTEVFDRSLKADFAVANDQFAPVISPELAKSLARRPEMAAVSGFTSGEWRQDRDEKQVAAGDPATLRDVLNVQILDGEYSSLAAGQLFVEERTAKDKHYSVGDTIEMTFARTGTQQVRIGAIFARNELLGRYVVSNELYDRNFTDRFDFVVMAKKAPAVSAGAARAAIQEVVDEFPGVKVRDQTQVKEENRKQINQLLGLISALLALAIIIALFGIVNTLALSVFERTRELGLLRAVGMARRQVRAMVRAESVITSIMGAVLGLAVGIFFGAALQRALDAQGITSLVIPVGQLISYVILAGLAGVFAAVWPARRAARLDVLAAVTHD